MIVGHQLRALKAHLERGGVVAYATRAVFGLGAAPHSSHGIRRLLRLKRRPWQKGLIVIAHQAQKLARFHGPLTAAETTRMHSRWPGNHTWLVPAHPHCHGDITGNRRPRLVALRVDDYPATQMLCRLLNMALISTSANRTGQRPAKSFREVARRFGTTQLRIIAGRTRHGAKPSRIERLAGGLVRG
jgi:L-threonylcarbamoyladenylate synthase